MKKFIAIVLTFILTAVLCTGSYASDANILYNIINKPTKDNSGYNIINNIIRGKKESTKVKIINEDKIDNELEKDKDDDAYIKGLDVSKWNGIIDWDKIEKAGVKFVIFRAGYGSKANSDIYFKKNIEGAIKHHMIIGIYWFSYAQTESMAANEAKQCIKTIKAYKKNITLPIFYDFEYDSVKRANSNGVRINKDKASKMADSFCKTIEKSGYKAGIYTNIDYANRYFNRSVLNKYNTWIAQWADNCTYRYKYIIWQKSSSYYVGNKRFDLNYFYYNRVK